MNTCTEVQNEIKQEYKHQKSCLARNNENPKSLCDIEKQFKGLLGARRSYNGPQANIG